MYHYYFRINNLQIGNGNANSQSLNNMNEFEDKINDLKQKTKFLKAAIHQIHHKIKFSENWPQLSQEQLN